MKDDAPPLSYSAAAAPPAVVTPAIDEAEQALFLASSAALMGGVVARSGQFHPVPPRPAAQPSLSEIERLVDAALPSYASFLGTPAADASSFENNIGNDADALDAIASLAYAAATIATPPAKNDDVAKKFAQEPADVTNAAGILCQLMSGVVAAEDAREIADSAAEMMQIEEKKEEEDEEDEAYEPPEEPKSRPPTPAIFASAGSDSLVHPNRLAIAQDAEEVNRLHQYVRRDLLEVFVVPNTDVAEHSDDSDDEDDEYVERPSKKQKSATGTSVTATSTTRRLVTRRRSIPMTADLVPSTNSLAHRHYPGRVGLRCTACANVRPNAKGPNGKKVTVASKAAFYPLRLKNIYREVCAWQRIHFKKCPHVPDGVRARYDHYKKIDTSRGKVKYWESSARKIGLVNNPARDDGIVFAKTSFKS